MNMYCINMNRFEWHICRGRGRESEREWTERKQAELFRVVCVCAYDSSIGGPCLIILLIVFSPPQLSSVLSPVVNEISNENASGTDAAIPFFIGGMCSFLSFRH